MLVLERKDGQGLRLTLPDGREAWVWLRLEGKKAALMVQAPEDVVVSRSELVERERGPSGGGGR